MKKYFGWFTVLTGFLALSVFLSPTGHSESTLSNDDIRAGKFYPFKSARVEYKKSGMSNGTEVLWIDDYGRVQVREADITTKVMGFSNTENVRTIITPEMITNINLKNNTAVRMPNPMQSFYQKLKTMNDEEIENFKKSGMQMAQQMTGKEKIEPVGKDTILGKECEIYEVEMMGVKTKSWNWNSLSLRLESNAMGQENVDEAVSLKLDVEIPSDKMGVPAGVQVQDMPAMGQMPMPSK